MGGGVATCKSVYEASHLVSTEMLKVTFLGLTLVCFQEIATTYTPGPTGDSPVTEHTEYLEQSHIKIKKADEEEYKSPQVHPTQAYL